MAIFSSYVLYHMTEAFLDGVWTTVHSCFMIIKEKNKCYDTTKKLFFHHFVNILCWMARTSAEHTCKEHTHHHLERKGAISCSFVPMSPKEIVAANYIGKSTPGTSIQQLYLYFRASCNILLLFVLFTLPICLDAFSRKTPYTEADIM